MSEPCVTKINLKLRLVKVRTRSTPQSTTSTLLLLWLWREKIKMQEPFCNRRKRPVPHRASRFGRAPWRWRVSCGRQWSSSTTTSFSIPPPLIQTRAWGAWKRRRHRRCELRLWFQLFWASWRRHYRNGGWGGCACGECKRRSRSLACWWCRFRNRGKRWWRWIP